MKRIIYSILAVTFLGAGYFVYQKYFSISALGESIFLKIENGRIYYAPAINGTVFVDLDHVTTDVIARHIILSSGALPTPSAIIDLNSRIYEIPKSIRKYELIESSSDTASYLTNIDLSEANYNNLWKNYYKTYQEYIDSSLVRYSKETSFRFDTINNQIIYRTGKRQETRLKYKVETLTDNYLVELVFVSSDESKKLASIFSIKI